MAERLQLDCELWADHDVGVQIMPRRPLLPVIIDHFLGFLRVKREIKSPEELPLGNVVLVVIGEVVFEFSMPSEDLSIEIRYLNLRVKVQREVVCLFVLDVLSWASLPFSSSAWCLSWSGQWPFCAWGGRRSLFWPALTLRREEQIDIPLGRDLLLEFYERHFDLGRFLRSCH